MVIVAVVKNELTMVPMFIVTLVTVLVVDDGGEEYRL